MSGALPSATWQAPGLSMADLPEPDLVRADAPDARNWGIAGAIATALHAAVIAAVIYAVVPTEPQVPEPVVLMELPPLAGQPAADPTVTTPNQPQPPLPQPRLQTPPIDIPPVRAPLPSNPVTLPPPQPQVRPVQASAPQPVSPASVPQPAQRAGVPDGADTPGNDPRAQKLEADYKSLVGSYIRRNKFSPPQSRKAGISGDVKVRFVVQRNGAITDVSVAGSSGKALLDGEAMEFLRRLTPVPSFPRDLRKSEIPLTITLKFDLESK